MPHIIIAGAGIGGLTAALALARFGARVTLFERAPKLEAAGAGLQLSPNATRVLRRLGLLDAVQARAFQPIGIRVRNARNGRLLSYMSLQDAERRWGAPYLVVHRADLQDVLQTAAAAETAISLHLNTTLAGFGTTTSGVAATVKQAGITRAVEGDALIGADGIRSTIRARLVDGDDALRDTGYTAWRTLIPAEKVAPMFSAPETGLWLGPDAHLVHYPIDGGRQINIVAITRETPTGNEADIWSAPGDPALVRHRFHRWTSDARRLIDAAPSWTTWPLFDRAPLAAWHAHRIALLGDAAHPILPFLAQGSAQAIEDASALAEALARTRDLSEALADYSRIRQAKATRVQDTSRRLGRIYHLAGPAALARNAGMQLMGGARLIHRYDWLYGLQLQKT